MRILGVLSSILLPRDSKFEANTPSTFLTLMQALFLLHQSLLTHVGDDGEITLVKQLFSEMRGGVCGEFDKVSLKEEYGAVFSRKDDDQEVREVLISESLSRCLENGVEASRRWFLRNLEVRVSRLGTGLLIMEIIGALACAPAITVTHATTHSYP
jgi:hypothetical protein